jgi:hypothetical protein
LGIFLARKWILFIEQRFHKKDSIHKILDNNFSHKFDRED